MTRKQFAMLVSIMVLLTTALACIILYQEEARKRGILNTDTLCAAIEKITKEPCRLVPPPSGLTEQPERLKTAVKY